MKKYLSIVALSIFLFGCHELVEEKKIVDDFYLVAVDSREDAIVSIKAGDSDNYIGLTHPVIVAYGFSNNYLFMKHIPVSYIEYTEDFGPDQFNYYILRHSEKIDEYNFEKFLLGPLNYSDFIDFCESIGIDPDDIFKNKYGADYCKSFPGLL